MERIGLADAIRALRAELRESVRAGAGEDLRFQVGEVELQFQVEIERSREGGGGIRFWVVELGGKTSQASTTTHLVTIPLTPVTSEGKPIVTGLQGDQVPERPGGDQRGCAAL
jgi:hypothetical protein